MKKSWIVISIIISAGMFFAAKQIPSINSMEQIGVIRYLKYLSIWSPFIKLNETSELDLVRKIRDQESVAHDQECIGNFYDFAYRQSSVDFDKPNEIMPGNQWVKIYDLEKELGDDRYYTLLGTSPLGSNNVLWFEWWSQQGVMFDQQYFILIDLNTKLVVQVPKVIGEKDAFADELIFFPDGSVWAIAEKVRFNDLVKVTYLVRFDSTLMQFVEVPGFSEISYQEERWQNRDLGPVFMTPKGTILFFLVPDGLYEYDPVLKKTVLRLETNEGLNSAFLDEDGRVYFLPTLKHDNPRMIKLFRFSTETGKLDTYNLVPIERVSWNIFKDKSGYIWLDSQTIIDPEKHIYNLHPNFVQWNANMRTVRSEYYVLPQLLFQASNGFIWFESKRIRGGGTAWFDPKSGESCWFTTYAGGTVEASDGTIWSLANNTLFKFNAK